MHSTCRLALCGTRTSLASKKHPWGGKLGHRYGCPPVSPAGILGVVSRPAPTMWQDGRPASQPSFLTSSRRKPLAPPPHHPPNSTHFLSTEVDGPTVRPTVLALEESKGKEFYSGCEQSSCIDASRGDFCQTEGMGAGLLLRLLSSVILLQGVEVRSERARETAVCSRSLPRPRCSRGPNKALPEFLVGPLVNFYWMSKAKNPGRYQIYGPQCVAHPLLRRGSGHLWDPERSFPVGSKWPPEACLPDPGGSGPSSRQHCPRLLVLSPLLPFSASPLCPLLSRVHTGQPQPHSSRLVRPLAAHGAPRPAASRGQRGQPHPCGPWPRGPSLPGESQ